MVTSFNHLVCMHVALIKQICTCIMKKYTFKANHLMKQYYYSIPSQTALKGKNLHYLGAHSFLKDKSQFLKRPKSMIITACFSSLPLMCGLAMTCLEKVLNLGDNCIQNFNLGRYIVGYTVGNLVLRRRASGAVKRDFRTYIRRYTSPN